MNQKTTSAEIKAPDIASLSIPETLVALKVDLEKGSTPPRWKPAGRRMASNEVAEKKEHPVWAFLRKFWGISAWMLELIMILSAVLGKYSDLAVVGALLVINAILSFMQEQRAAGVVETLRKRLQVSARVLRGAAWQLIRPASWFRAISSASAWGISSPADVKLLSDVLKVDQSALTGESMM